MSGGHGAHVDNGIWMRAVMMGGMLLTIGVLLFATLGVFMANEKHHVWEDLEDDYHHMEVQFALDSSDEGANISQHEADELDHLHHEEIAAHLSYLTYRVAGITILLMSITYAAFIGVGGFLNASKPNAEHDDGHGDEHEHHGSSSPIIFAFGIMLFLAGFPDFVIACKAMLNADITPDFGMLGLSMVGLLTIVIAVSNWWFEDLPFNGHGEQIATSYPFEGEPVSYTHLTLPTKRIV